jgi:predicted protein tyrosine phosphatase
MGLVADANLAIELQALSRAGIIHMEERKHTRNIMKHTNKNISKDAFLGLKEIQKKLERSS